MKFKVDIPLNVINLLYYCLMICCGCALLLIIRFGLKQVIDIVALMGVVMLILFIYTILMKRWQIIVDEECLKLTPLMKKTKVINIKDIDQLSFTKRNDIIIYVANKPFIKVTRESKNYDKLKAYLIKKQVKVIL